MVQLFLKAWWEEIAFFDHVSDKDGLGISHAALGDLDLCFSVNPHFLALLKKTLSLKPLNSCGFVFWSRKKILGSGSTLWRGYASHWAYENLPEFGSGGHLGVCLWHCWRCSWCYDTLSSSSWEGWELPCLWLEGRAGFPPQVFFPDVAAVVSTRRRGRGDVSAVSGCACWHGDRVGKERETASFACMGKESVGLGGRSSTGDGGVVEGKGRDLGIKWEGLVESVHGKVWQQGEEEWLELETEGETRTERRNGEQKHVVRIWWWTGTRDLGLQNQWFPNFQWLDCIITTLCPSRLPPHTAFCAIQLLLLPCPTWIALPSGDDLNFGWCYVEPAVGLSAPYWVTSKTGYSDSIILWSPCSEEQLLLLIVHFAPPSSSCGLATGGMAAVRVPIKSHTMLLCCGPPGFISLTPAVSWCGFSTGRIYSSVY